MNKENILPIIDEFIISQKLAVTKLDLTGFIAYKADKANLLELLTFLKDSPDLRFTILTDLFAADFPSRHKRFELVYNLLSLELNERIIIKVEVAKEEALPSATKIFSASCWYEREVFDMFGVMFEGSHDVRRILTDYGFVGHPLCKDFPLTGYVEVTYDPKLEKVIYQPVKFDQEFRDFDFTSPWQGPDYILPGDEKATK